MDNRPASQAWTDAIVVGAMETADALVALRDRDGNVDINAMFTVLVDHQTRIGMATGEALRRLEDRIAALEA